MIISKKNAYALEKLIQSTNKNFDIKKYLLNIDTNESLEDGEFDKLKEFKIYFNNIKIMAKEDYHNSELSHSQKLNALSVYFGFKDFHVMSAAYNKYCIDVQNKLEDYSPPSKNGSFDIYSVTHKNDIPDDSFHCAMDMDFCDVVSDYCLETGEDDYRLMVAFDSNLEKQLSKLYNS